MTTSMPNATTNRKDTARSTSSAASARESWRIARSGTATTRFASAHLLGPVTTRHPFPRKHLSTPEAVVVSTATMRCGHGSFGGPRAARQARCEVNARRFQEGAAWRGPNLRHARDVAPRAVVELLHFFLSPLRATVRACARGHRRCTGGKAGALALRGQASSGEDTHSGAAQRASARSRFRGGRARGRRVVVVVARACAVQLPPEASALS